MKVIILMITLACLKLNAQGLKSIKLHDFKITDVETDSTTVHSLARPLISFDVTRNGKIIPSGKINLSLSPAGFISGSVRYQITFKNNSTDTLSLSNVTPLDRFNDHLYITGLGDHPLSRTHLFLSGQKPVNIIVPDNAWELGYASIPLSGDLSLCALSRRDPESIQHGKRKRFETVLYPNGSVIYSLYFDLFSGEWQNGLKKIFQEKMLFDVVSFDYSLYQRSDLKWINQAYVMHLLMAWDKQYYDYATGKIRLPDFVRKGKEIYGGDDVVCLWPTWPTLGMDQRNQFDMYRDLPGGLPTLRILADTLRKLNCKFFIAYNPWDESTRSQSHLQGLKELIRETSADGVVLDTKGESSKELQAAADKVKTGVIMYSEGMAVPKDMSGIIAGRVHNALYYPPLLNLNKLIKPDFAIFRVAEVYKEPIIREYATSFFNGYGTEINQFVSGHPDWEQEQYRFLGKTSMLLRQNSTCFTSRDFTPLLPTTHDSIWVNRWATPGKTIYTIFSLKPEGFNDLLFRVKPVKGFHFVDLWSHQLLTPTKKNTGEWLPGKTDAFSSWFLGTNNEGAVSCIAELPEIISLKLNGSTLSFSTTKKCTVKIWLGSPAYDKSPIALTQSPGSVDLIRSAGVAEGKIIAQAFENGQLIDETTLEIKDGQPLLISLVEKTIPEKIPPRGMVKIPAGKFTFHSTHGDDFIRYPSDHEGETHDMPSFFMDRFPVTNHDFNIFLNATRYQPTDTSNFLKHWKNKKIPWGQENFPVVYISYEDAQAYAKWAGKRLPTEIEWQYAAQTPSAREWPWNQTKPVVRKKEKITETLTVFSLQGIDAGRCNMGDGKPYAVGKFPQGANPYGLEDLVGSVWQMTHDVYESGSYRYIMLKGGSYFKPNSSWWYVQGGPRELHYKQYLLRVSQGFERNATVGFRCLKDGIP